MRGNPFKKKRMVIEDRIKLGTIGVLDARRRRQLVDVEIEAWRSGYKACRWGLVEHAIDATLLLALGAVKGTWRFCWTAVAASARGLRAMCKDCVRPRIRIHA
ncbi:MAG: hypothetical protein V3W51_04775 [Candidatus Brocadiales bacterium]